MQLCVIFFCFVCCCCYFLHFFLHVQGDMLYNYTQLEMCFKYIHNYRFISIQFARERCFAFKIPKDVQYTHSKLIYSYFSLFLKYFFLYSLNSSMQYKIHIQIHASKCTDTFILCGHTHRMNICTNTENVWVGIRRASHQIWFVFDLSLFAYATKTQWDRAQAKHTYHNFCHCVCYVFVFILCLCSCM